LFFIPFKKIEKNYREYLSRKNNPAPRIAQNQMFINSSWSSFTDNTKMYWERSFVFFPSAYK